jgi:ferredoxin-NADP reductase
MSAQPQPRPQTSRSRFKRILAPVVDPAVFDFWASRINRSWSWERPLARIVGREQASSDAVTLLLAPNRHVGGFKPGQHVNLSAEIDGVRITRSYSLTGLPRADGQLSITVKAIAGGKLSQHLCQRARIGDVLSIGPAFGEMQLPQPAEGEYLFLAAGSGITPLMALTRSLAAQGMPVPLTLMYWARTRGELCFVDELHALAAAQPRFRLHLLLTRDTPREVDAPTGRISEALLARLVEQPAQQHVMACGPGGFVETARGLLGAQARSFQAEAFTLPPVESVDTGTVQVRLAKRGVTLQLPRGQSLLSALEAEGIRPVSGCRMGICNTCACGKSAGSTRHLPSGGLAHEPASALKLCINSAVTDLELDL